MAWKSNRQGTPTDWAIATEIEFEKNFIDSYGNEKKFLRGYHKPSAGESLEGSINHIIVNFLPKMKSNYREKTIKEIRLYRYIEDYTFNECWFATLSYDANGLLGIMSTSKLRYKFEYVLQAIEDVLDRIHKRSSQFEIAQFTARNQYIKYVNEIEINFSKLIFDVLTDEFQREVFIETIKSIDVKCFEEKREDWKNEAREAIEKDNVLCGLSVEARNEKFKIFYVRQLQNVIINEQKKRVEAKVSQYQES